MYPVRHEDRRNSKTALTDRREIQRGYVSAMYEPDVFTIDISPIIYYLGIIIEIEQKCQK